MFCHLKHIWKASRPGFLLIWNFTSNTSFSACVMYNVVKNVQHSLAIKVLWFSCQKVFYRSPKADFVTLSCTCFIELQIVSQSLYIHLFIYFCWCNIYNLSFFSCRNSTSIVMRWQLLTWTDSRSQLASTGKQTDRQMIV